MAFGKGVEKMTDYIVPVLLLFVSVFALRKKENSYDLMLSGATEGLKLLITLIPALILLLTAVSMLRASGAIAWISRFLSPVSTGFQRFVALPPPHTYITIIVRQKVRPKC